jgi:hypothetical protein
VKSLRNYKGINYFWQARGFEPAGDPVQRGVEMIAPAVLSPLS